MFNLPQNSFYVMILVIVLLTISSIISLVLKTMNPSYDYTELRQRIRSWWWMIVILFTVLIVSTKTSIIFLGFLSFLALKEFCSIVNIRQADRRILFWAYLSIPVQYYFVFIGWYGMFIIFIPVHIFILANTYGANWSNQGVYKISRNYSLVHNVNRLLHKSHCVLISIARKKCRVW